MTDVLRADGKIADVGCGPGAPTIMMAAAFALGGEVLSTEMETLRLDVAQRFWGLITVIRQAAPKMTTGSITCLSGQHGSRPVVGAVVTSAMHAAVEVLSQGLALELAPIRVNAVAPGLIDTPSWVISGIRVRSGRRPRSRSKDRDGRGGRAGCHAADDQRLHNGGSPPCRRWWPIRLTLVLAPLSRGDARRRTCCPHLRSQFHPLTAEVQLRTKVRASAVRSSTNGPPRTSTRQCCSGPIGCIPVTAPVAKTMPARTG
jgi:hypothetical protein